MVVVPTSDEQPVEVREDGTFSVRVKPGRHRVEWHRSHEYGEGGPPSVESKTVMVASGDTVRVDFAEGVRVTGEVLLDGEPIGDVKLVWTMWEGQRPGGNLPGGVSVARTGPEGKYEIPAVPPGSYSVRLRHGDVESVFERLVGDEEATFDFTLESESTIQGTLLASDSGEVVSDARVVAFRSEKSMPLSERVWDLGAAGRVRTTQGSGTQFLTRSDADGSFSLPLTAGAWQLAVHADGFREKRKDVLVGDSTTQPFDLFLDRSHDLLVKARDSFGRGIAGVAVLGICSSAPTEIRRSLTQEGGLVSLSDLAAGPCAFFFHSRNEAGLLSWRGGRGGGIETGEVVSVFLSPPGELRVILPQEAPAVARGSIPIRVFTDDGVSLSPLYRILQRQMGARVEQRGDRYEVVFPRIPAGNYRVAWLNDSAKEVTVVSAQASVVDLGTQ